MLKGINDETQLTNKSSNHTMPKILLLDLNKQLDKQKYFKRIAYRKVIE